ncbi:MAG: hypothetical protein J6Z49_09830 [Kiritimatiellae bacterium]|nr:hypothetical protein [Kiritimatiellia bacterium]
MALRYNDQTGEFEEVEERGASRRSRRPSSPRRRSSGGSGWDSDTIIGCGLLVVVAVAAIWFLKSIAIVLLGSKWFWIVLVLAIIGYKSSKD